MFVVVERTSWHGGGSVSTQCVVPLSGCRVRGTTSYVIKLNRVEEAEASDRGSEIIADISINYSGFLLTRILSFL